VNSLVSPSPLPRSEDVDLLQLAGKTLHAATTERRNAQVWSAGQGYPAPKDMWDEDTFRFSVAVWLCSTAAEIERRGVTAKLTTAEQAAIRTANLVMMRYPKEQT
jgi:hypothetical protein